MQTPQALNAAFASGDPHNVIVESLRFAGAKTVVDVGCGEGRLAARLLDDGFEVAGADPSPRAIEKAREKASAARLELADAEHLPFEDKSFDAVVFLNSLHHVPSESLPGALGEARRIARPDAPILIVEPLPEGSLYEVMRPVEDEASAYHAAGVAIADAVRGEQLELKGNVVFQETVRYRSAGAFLDRLVAVDPARQAAAERCRAEVEALFERLAAKDGDQFALRQPLRIYWLRPLQT
ncbi:class I SAM-dependent methyltransferase [Jiella endophytica]|uniref:Class I SAM-dependent methyltransferase n=1 Tax=Jiella endophytica TaxID=2558362 RepID=A0A4Y8RQJ8_9HYPH|nr:class I SAM-dependent methyltransferase [Jiella endophytica]TFF25581.1 class I SAM-dependent methyltransferase [Jiella endophytica]